MKRNNYPNLAPTKISVPEYTRKELFKDGHVFILHNLMEDLYSVHLCEKNREPEFRYLENDYNNDDLSHVNYISYEVPEPYTSTFEVYKVYEYDSISQSFNRIFYREDEQWQKKIELPDIEPGMFVVVKYENKIQYALSTLYEDGNIHLIYDNGGYDIYKNIKGITESESFNGIILFIGKNFNCFNSVQSYLNYFYKNKKAPSYITGKPTFIHPYFHELYESHYKEE